MDLIQVTAYPAMGALLVQVTTASATESGRNWEHRVLERLDIPDGADSAWDLIWMVGMLMVQRAELHGRAYGAGDRTGG